MISSQIENDPEDICKNNHHIFCNGVEILIKLRSTGWVWNVLQETIFSKRQFNHTYDRGCVRISKSCGLLDSAIFRKLGNRGSGWCWWSLMIWWFSKNRCSKALLILWQPGSNQVRSHIIAMRQNSAKTGAATISLDDNEEPIDRHSTVLLNLETWTVFRIKSSVSSCHTFLRTNNNQNCNKLFDLTGWQ